MEIIINHTKKKFDTPPRSVAELLEIEGIRASKGIAVALNQQVVPKEEWLSTAVHDQDQLLIITATQGG